MNIGNRSIYQGWLVDVTTMSIGVSFLQKGRQAAVALAAA